MKEFAIKPWLQILAWVIAIIIVSLNLNWLINNLIEWTNTVENPMLLYLTAYPLFIGAIILLAYITFSPFVQKLKHKHVLAPDGVVKDLTLSGEKIYKKIAIAVDFSFADAQAISHALSQGGKHAEYFLIHIVETAGARMMESDIDDMETSLDKINLEKYTHILQEKGYQIESILGFGNPKKTIPEIVNKNGADLLVMGAHGHTGFKDILFGTTLDAVRHRVKVPVLIVGELQQNSH